MTLRIVQLTAENVKRLVAVHIEPNGNIVEITGKNGAGKSSVLDSIWYALGGTKNIPDVPLREGQRKGSIELKLSGDDESPAMIVTRTFDAKKGTSLVVKLDKRNAVPLTSPQKILDSLCGKIAFDPLAFANETPKKQANQLKELVGLDFSEQDAKRKGLFDERAQVNRELKSLEAQLDACETFGDAPADEVSVAELMGELGKAQTMNRMKGEAQKKVTDSGAEIARIAADAMPIVTRLEEAQRQLDAVKAELADNAAKRKGEQSRQKTYREAADAMPTVDCVPIDEKIQSADEVNRQVRANKAAAAFQADIDTAEADKDRLSLGITGIDGDKAGMMASAKWPVPGLGFGEDGITLQGLPFEQASQAEKEEISVAMALAGKPRLPVMLLRNGSLYDSDTRARLLVLAEKHDAQVWIERVGDGGEAAVVIEEGRVKAEK